MITEAAGAEEYAIWGWAKWIDSTYKGWYSIYRVSDFDTPDFDDNSKMGDRNLAGWLGEGVALIEHYNSPFVGGGKKDELIKFSHGNNPTSWYFIYHSYSARENKVSSYIKWDTKVDSKIFTNVRHFTPTNLRIDLGYDGFYKSFNGILKDWKFSYGPGSYRESGFEVLYNPPAPVVVPVIT